MGVRDSLNGLPVTADEVAAAERLAQALEGREPADLDREALAAAHLLQAIAAPADDLARRRLRVELVWAAVRAHRSMTVRRRVLATAAVATVAVGAGVLWRLAGQPAQSLLAEREQVANSAVAAVAGWDAEAAAAARLDSAFDRQWRNRVTLKLETERASLLSEREAANAPSKASEITRPGGDS